MHVGVATFGGPTQPHVPAAAAHEVGGVQVWQMPLVQMALAQSGRLTHPWPTPHLLGQVPPQSTPVSVPFLRPSLQVTLQLPARHRPPFAQGNPSPVALHLPFLQCFLPFFLRHWPLSHFWHSPHWGVHLPDVAFASAASGSVRPSRPTAAARDPARAAARARRREPVSIRERARRSNRSGSMADPLSD